MKKRNNSYYILTYLFFIYPPFIWGLVLIYQDSPTSKEHITSLWINLIVWLVIGFVCGLLVYLKKLHLPSDDEIKHVIFGIIGNIVVYFYTFQNLMKIDDFVTIYLILIIILGVHALLISKRLIAKELWLLMPIFLFLDIVHMISTGCGYTDGSVCYGNTAGVMEYIVYSLMLLISIGYYLYKIYLLRQFDILKIINAVLITIMSITIQFEDVNEEFMLTVAIAMPFFTIMDFIVNIVNKKYTHKMLFHYVRAYTILMLFSVMGGMGFFYGEVNYEMLNLMVTIAYVSFFIVIFRTLLKVDSIKEVRVNREIMFMNYSNIHKEELLDEYGEVAINHMSLDDNAFSLIAVHNDCIVGFISTYTKQLEVPLERQNEAYINIIEVHENYRNQGIATTLVSKTERHFKSKNIQQIRAWSSTDKVEALHFWNKLGYTLAYAHIYIEDKDISVKGYYATKKL